MSAQRSTIILIILALSILIPVHMIGRYHGKAEIHEYRVSVFAEGIRGEIQ